MVHVSLSAEILPHKACSMGVGMNNSPRSPVWVLGTQTSTLASIRNSSVEVIPALRSAARRRWHR